MPKMENIPPCPDAIRGVKTGVEKSFQIELITPMFGGGAEAKLADTSLPIRPTSIRGHLQFWWRATVGAAFSTPEELRDAQSKLWGSTTLASPVTVSLGDVNSDRAVQCALIQWNPNARRGEGGFGTNWQSPFNIIGTSLPYALFPFQGVVPRPDRNAVVESPPSDCIHHATFHLRIHVPEALAEQVETAIWAWVNFGGLGSRTRRGCGSLFCKQFATKDANELKARLEKHSAFPVREWPTVSTTAFLGGSTRDSIAAWNEAIKIMQVFRQGVGTGRNPGEQPNRPGRSRRVNAFNLRRVPSSESPAETRSHIPREVASDECLPCASGCA